MVNLACILNDSSWLLKISYFGWCNDLSGNFLAFASNFSLVPGVIQLLKSWRVH